MSKIGVVRTLRVGNLKIEAYESTEAMGRAAAESAAESLRRLAAGNDTIGVIFATGASQMATLDALTSIPGLPWDRLSVFTWMNTWESLKIIRLPFDVICG